MTQPTPSAPVVPPAAPPPHVAMLIIGAGLSGIDAAYRFQTGCPGQPYAILEARDAIGGTWDLFRYPGIRSDSDMATLGFPFRPWRGEKSIVAGADIRDYVVDTARAYGIDRRIRFGHRVIAAAWSSEEARWTVTAAGPDGAIVLTSDFLFACSGYYDYAAGHAPAWPDSETFGGTIVHPQFWPQGAPVAGKRIVVVGSGATAVTLVPALAAQGAHVIMLQRSPSYVVSQPTRDRNAERLRRWLPAALADPAVRWKNVAYSIVTYRFARKQPARVRALIRAGVRQQLGRDYDVDTHFNPRYDPWDQRMCIVPDGDLFAAIRQGQAEIVTDRIERFTPTGLKLASGGTIDADMIVTATGLSIKLLGGVAISVDGRIADVAGRLVYKGAMADGIPNFAFAFGYTNASWTLKCDLTARFVAGLVRHMRRRGLAIVTPVSSAADAGTEPMLDFKSGYVERAAALLPAQGPRAPWRVHQNYARDLLAFKTARYADGVLRFARRSGDRRRAA